MLAAERRRPEKETYRQDCLYNSFLQEQFLLSGQLLNETLPRGPQAISAFDILMDLPYPLIFYAYKQLYDQIY